jgi:hypothetical protein
MSGRLLIVLIILSALLLLVELKPNTKNCIMELDTEYIVESDDNNIVTARHKASDAVELVIIRYKTDVEIYQCSGI